MILSSFILSSSGMFYDSGAYVSGAFISEQNSDLDGDDFTTAQYGGWVGYFVNPNIEVYAGGSIFDETYDNSLFSEYNTNGTQFDFGGAYHYRDALDMNGNSLNLRFGGEYSMMTMDGDWLAGIDASGTNFSINGGVYMPMKLANFNVTPFVTLSSNNMTIKLSFDGTNIEESEKSTVTSVGMGLNIAQFVLSPVIHLYESGDTAFVLAGSIGL